MFTNLTSNISNCLQQKAYGLRLPRPVIVRFSFTSRWVLVSSSFVSRSSLVRYSLVYRRPNEDRTRTERGTSKKRTKEQRTSVEKPTRNYRKLDEKLPNLMGKAAFWFPTLSQMSWTELLLSLQDVVRYAT